MGATPSLPSGPRQAFRAIGEALDASEPVAAEPIERSRFDGLAWRFRRGFEHVLETLPAAVWADPGRQGWQRVKHNASRTVWRARIDGRAYYLKYYSHQGWPERLKQLWRGPTSEVEFKGGMYALGERISAARPVACTEQITCAGRTYSLLVTEAIEPAYPLNEYWETLRADDDAARRRRDSADLIDLLAEMIARAHQSGFEHRDMHAANILVHPIAPARYETAFVDLQSARLGKPLSDQAVVRNLAQLNQWFRRHSSISDRLRFLRRYVRWRNEYEQTFEHSRSLDLSFEQLVHALVDHAAQHAGRLWAKRDRRARRSSQYFSRITVGGGWRGLAYLRCKRSTAESPASSLVFEKEWWRTQLRNPSRWFDPATSPPCKQSHSALVARALLAIKNGDLPVIVKRPRARDWRRSLRQLFAPSRSLRGWRTGYVLLNRDIPTARPLAVLEKRVGPLVLDSVLLTEAIPGAVDLDAYLRREFEARSHSAWWQHKCQLSKLLVWHVRQLAECRLVHRDCKAQNVLVVAQPRLKLVWIDMDGLKHVGHVSLNQQLRALARLHVSLLDLPGLTRTDRARFLIAYLARFGSNPRAWRDVWRRLSRAAEKKVRAQQLRRQWKLKHYGRT